MTVALALILDALMGEPRWLWSRAPHPAVLFGRVIGWADQRFNHGKNRRIKGLILVAFLCAAGFGIGTAIESLPTIIPDILIGAILLAQRSLVDHVKAVSNALRMSVSEGRRAVAMIVGRDTTNMRSDDVARAAIESAAENFSDGVVAPAFWFLTMGLPGLIAYKVVNTADSMIGYRTPCHEEFGWAAARLDDVLNLVPARLTALLFWLPNRCATPLQIRKDARLHRSPNAGWPEAAIAPELGLALSGPRSYHGRRKEYPWVNAGGRKTATPDDIDGSLDILWRSWAMLTCLCLLSGVLFCL